MELQDLTLHDDSSEKQVVDTFKHREQLMELANELKELEEQITRQPNIDERELESDIDEAVYETEEEMRERNKSEFRTDLEHLINSHCMENGSNTPDFLLADYLMGCLDVFDKVVSARAKWWDHSEWDDILGTNTNQEI